MLGLPHLRLRHKLALSLSLAALLPVVLAATVAVRLVLHSLEEGLKDQTKRQRDVGMNLVLRNVERIGRDAVRLASTPALVVAIADPVSADRAVAAVLAREDPNLPSARAQVYDQHGRLLAERAIGGNDDRYAGLSHDVCIPLVERGLQYERRVTISAEGERLVVHAVAPIVNPSFQLHGVVLLTLPLDGDFADGIKAALGADVLIHAGAGPAQSSFLGPDGARAVGIEPPEHVAAGVLSGGTSEAKETIEGHEYLLGYAPLKDLDEQYIGMFGVAVGRGALVRAKEAAKRSLYWGAAGAFLFALGLAGILSRRLTGPLARLHAGAQAIGRGDLDVRLSHVGQGDEIGDLASAFMSMTQNLRENQDRLAARMGEIVALHDAGRAVSSVLGLADVLRKIVDSIARVLDTRLAGLWLVGEKAGDPLVIGAARARVGRSRDAGTSQVLTASDASDQATSLGELAAEVGRVPMRIDDVSSHPRWRIAAKAARVDGSILAVPLERGDRVVGVLVVGRGAGQPAFNDADENLITTFADQAATAIENARLYERVRAFSTELEEKVKLRTQELVATNDELGRALTELRDTQAQLILSDRMAGLGALVAGVAHEINSPSAAIRGSVDALSDNVRRLARFARELGELKMSVEVRTRLLGMVEELAPELAEKRVAAPTEVRRRTRALAARLAESGVRGAESVARALAEICADEAEETLLPFLRELPPDLIVSYVREYTYLHRNASAIQTAIKQIQRIVGALKSYSHLDQAKVEPADVHEGIENTLVILHHELKYGISIQRRFGQLPRIPVYVDELNQVWTNLIHNAVQALKGKGEIVIETEAPSDGGEVAVRVIDNGPGIPAEVKPRIFEPFFTTKVKGEGTGLGLGIVRKIVDKHGGRVEVDSVPGRTCFTVWLPVTGPQAAAKSSPRVSVA